MAKLHVRNLGTTPGASPKVTLRLDNETIDELDGRANRLGVGRSELVRLAVRRYLEHDEEAMSA